MREKKVKFHVFERCSLIGERFGFLDRSSKTILDILINRLERYSGRSSDENYAPLIEARDKYIEDYTDKQSIREIKGQNLYDVFFKELKLDYDFARFLSISDVVECSCFEFNTENGRLIRRLIEGLYFVVTKKIWEKDVLMIHFECSNMEDGNDEVIAKLLSGEYYR